ncbi:MAG: hypothetical protein ACI9PY_002692 [Ascidiaceihabitans sp.]|jgi:hypothetical protein
MSDNEVISAHLRNIIRESNHFSIKFLLSNNVLTELAVKVLKAKHLGQ